MAQEMDCVIIGGGASGFFFAANYAKRHPAHKVCILEKSSKVLQKVKISGGGRCNVTHAEFFPKELTTNYPRGERELIGPFHKFMTGDMMAWLEERGVKLKIEDDGRIFPVSDDAQTIIDCFMDEVSQYNVKVCTSQAVKSFEHLDGVWKVQTKKDTLIAKELVISTGSSLKIWDQLKELGHKILPPVPSLFTLVVNDPELTKLKGLSLKTRIELYASVNDKNCLLSSSGDTLITHWGLSGPCVLKLSAWGAAQLHELNYQCCIKVNWLPHLHTDTLNSLLRKEKQRAARKQVNKQAQFHLPKRFWSFLIDSAGIDQTKLWADLSKSELNAITRSLTATYLEINGKSTYKEEFVTAGGVDLKEIDLRNYRSKKLPQLKIIGEALNIDAITGGFNFQSAWTSAYIAATSESS